MKINLFVDDWRIPPDGWELARTITEAIEILSTESVRYLSLDHDIQVEGFDGTSRMDYFSAETYATVAKYFVQMPRERQSPVVFIHSANNNGALKIARILSQSKAKIVRVSPMAYQDEIPEFLKKWERHRKEV